MHIKTTYCRTQQNVDDPFYYLRPEPQNLDSQVQLVGPSCYPTVKKAQMLDK